MRPWTRCWRRRALGGEAQEGSRSSSRRRRAPPIASAAGSAKPSSAFAVFVSVFHLYAAAAGSPFFAGRRSSRPTICGRLHVGMVLTLVYLLFPMFRALAQPRHARSTGCAPPPASASSPTSLSQGTEFGERAIDPEPLDFYVGIVLILLLLEATRRVDRLDHAGRGADLHRLRAVRQIPAAAVDASRLHLRAPRRPSLHDAGGRVRHDGGGLLQPHHSVHDFRRRSCSIPAPASSSSISRSPPWAASAMPPAAPSCSPRSCWAVRRARASPPPSPSAPSPIRCWRRPATRRTPPAACSRPAVSAPSSRRPCWAPPPS